MCPLPSRVSHSHHHYHHHHSQESTAAIPLVNYTDVERLLEGNPTVQGTAPRWLGLGRVANTDNPLLNTSVVLLVLDSEAEEKAKIGEAWGRRPLGEQETYIVWLGTLPRTCTQEALGSLIAICVPARVANGDHSPTLRCWK